MVNNSNRPKKYYDFEVEVIERLDCLQLAQAMSRQDFRQILREEIANALREHEARKAWSRIA